MVVVVGLEANSFLVPRSKRREAVIYKHQHTSLALSLSLSSRSLIISCLSVNLASIQTHTHTFCLPLLQADETRTVINERSRQHRSSALRWHGPASSQEGNEEGQVQQHVSQRAAHGLPLHRRRWRRSSLGKTITFATTCSTPKPCQFRHYQQKRSSASSSKTTLFI